VETKTILFCYCYCPPPPPPNLIISCVCVRCTEGSKRRSAPHTSCTPSHHSAPPPPRFSAGQPGGGGGEGLSAPGHCPVDSNCSDSLILDVMRCSLNRPVRRGRGGRRVLGHEISFYGGEILLGQPVGKTPGPASILGHLHTAWFTNPAPPLHPPSSHSVKHPQREGGDMKTRSGRQMGGRQKTPPPPLHRYLYPPPYQGGNHLPRRVREETR
jgi:hypothetical protein